MMWIPTKLRAEHWNTLRSQKSGEPMRADRNALIWVPVAVAAATAIWPPSNAGAILDGTAIITALLFTLLIHVFSLGLAASQDERIRDTWVMDLIDQLRVNTAYAIAVGILAVIFLSAASAYNTAPDLLQRGLTAPGIGLVVHLLMTLGMVIKRVNSAYVEMRRLSKLVR